MTPFEQAARRHIDSRRSAATRALYLSDLARWLVHCRERGTDAANPEPADAVVFLRDLEKSLSPQTVRRVLSALSRMYRTAVAAKPQAASWNPFDPDALPRPPADEVALTQDYAPGEVDRLLDAIAKTAEELPIGLRDMALVRCLHDAGMRVSTACGMRRDALRERDGQLYLVTTVKKKGRVEVALPADTAEALEAWLAVAPPSQWVFPALRGGGHLDRRAVNQRLEHYGKIANVEGAAPHRFRATFITEALDAGVPLNEVQASVHHASPVTTQRYDRRIRGAGVATALAKFREDRK